MAAKAYSFLIGDPVWAKMKGFSEWPAKIEMAPEHLKRPTTKKAMHCVFFFGTYNYGWVPDTNLKPYKEFKDKMKTTKKSVKKAIDEIEAYIEGGCKSNATTIIATSNGTADKAMSKKIPSKKPTNSSKLNASSNEDAKDVKVDTVLLETKTQTTSNSKSKKRVKSGDGNKDDNPKVKKAKMPRKKATNSSKLNALSNEDAKDVKVDASLLETNTPTNSNSKPKKRVESGDGNEDGNPKVKKAKMSRKKATNSSKLDASSNEDGIPKVKKAKIPRKKAAMVKSDEEQPTSNIDIKSMDTFNCYSCQKSVSGTLMNFYQHCRQHMPEDWESYEETRYMDYKLFSEGPAIIEVCIIIF